jgi:hypothetical protein
MKKFAFGLGVGVVAGTVATALSIRILSDAFTGVYLFFESIDKLMTSKSVRTNDINPSLN